MPTDAEHLTKYRVNKRLLDSDEMNVERTKHFEWVAIVAFYSAMHLIEKELFASPSSPQKHTSNHKERNDIISKYSEFRSIRSSYNILQTNCWKARYLAGRLSKLDAEQMIKNLSVIERNLLT